LNRGLREGRLIQNHSRQLLPERPASLDVVDALAIAYPYGGNRSWARLVRRRGAGWCGLPPPAALSTAGSRRARASSGCRGACGSGRSSLARQACDEGPRIWVRSVCRSSARAAPQASHSSASCAVVARLGWASRRPRKASSERSPRRLASRRLRSSVGGAEPRARFGGFVPRRPRAARRSVRAFARRHLRGRSDER
jgi:hypothetical protein